MHVCVRVLVAVLVCAAMAEGRTFASKKAEKRKLASRQICADLCTQGMGGPPCGDVCEYDLGHNFGVRVPDNMLPNETKRIVGPRRGVCPFLCRYELGDPLCGCQPLPYYHDKDTVDWHGVCDTFCHMEGVTIYGCPKCAQDPKLIPALALRPQELTPSFLRKPDVQSLIDRGYKIVAAFGKDGTALINKGGKITKMENNNGMQLPPSRENLSWKSGRHTEPVDWERWCSLMCLEGEGGAACNCDALP